MTDQISPTHAPSLFKDIIRDGGREVYFSFMVPVLFFSFVEINFSVGQKQAALLSFFCCSFGGRRRLYGLIAPNTFAAPLKNNTYKLIQQISTKLSSHLKPLISVYSFLVYYGSATSGFNF